MILGLAGIALVVFAFLSFANTQTGGLDFDAPATTAPTTEAPAPTTETEQPAEPEPAPEPPAPAEQTAAQHALAQLDTVEITPATRIPDYDRDLFGDAWEDVDGNGCDTRNDVLARDLTVTSKDGACKVLTGTLTDPYTGQVIDFVRGQQTSQAVQIDHIVSLSVAWKGGAWAWTDDQRVAFANDTEILLAVDGPANSRKSDKGPARWMPSNAGNSAYDCEYAIDYTYVLVKYDLTAPAEDIAALRSTLATC